MSGIALTSSRAALVLEDLSDDLLGPPACINIRCIDEVDSGIDRHVHLAPRPGEIHVTPREITLVPESARAQRNRRDAQPRVPQQSIFHARVFFLFGTSLWDDDVRALRTLRGSDGPCHVPARRRRRTGSILPEMEQMQGDKLRWLLLMVAKWGGW